MGNFGSFSDLSSLFNKLKTSLSKRPKTFTGTQDEWDALTVADRQEYEIVNITDDYTPSAGGGHVVEDAEGTELEQRDTLQFGGYLRTTDDDTNEKTVVTDEPETVTWSTWQTMSAAEKDGHKWLITGAPGGEGAGGGHIIEDSEGTELTQRDVLQVGGSLIAEDDPVNEKTIITNGRQTIDYEDWIELTPQEQAAIPEAVIINAPDNTGGGSIGSSVKYNPETDEIEIWDGTQWIEWRKANLDHTYLFTEGNFYNGATGIAGYASIWSGNTQQRLAPAVSIAGGMITVTGQGATNQSGTAFLEGTIDITNYSKIKAKIVSYVGDYNRILVASSKNDNYTNLADTGFISTVGDVEFDISSLTGTANIGIYIDRNYNMVIESIELIP